MTTTAKDLVIRIIKEQEAIIGPLAWSVAGEVKGLHTVRHSVSISGSGSIVLTDLVKKYEKLFGPASREVCRDAVRPLLSRTAKEDVPEVLR